MSKCFQILFVRLDKRHSLVSDDGKEKARCNACNQKYIIGSKNYGTSHLKRHIEKCSKLKCEYVRQMIVDGEGKLNERKI